MTEKGKHCYLEDGKKGRRKKARRGAKGHKIRRVSDRGGERKEGAVNHGRMEWNKLQSNLPPNWRNETNRTEKTGAYWV